MSTKVFKCTIANPRASCSHFIPLDIIRQSFPMIYFFIFSSGIKIENWSVMSHQRSSNLQNQFIIKVLMLTIQE